jgi:general secretion pathway protein G
MSIVRNQQRKACKGFTLRSRACEGFTLIELLVVVSLIGVLATLVLANFNAARQRGRDAQRKSDLRNIQAALRLYYNDYGKYPTGAGGVIMGCGATADTACDWGTSTFAAGTQTYMSTLPDDPLQDITYQYTRVDLDNYILSSCLENKSDDKGVADPSAAWCPTKVVYSVKP